MSEEIEVKNFTGPEDFTPCDVTGMKRIDDCYITIEFGYGSTRDMQTFKFDVCDHVGQMVLKYINNMYSNGKNIRHNVVQNLFTTGGNVDVP
jgi:hypothetical protein